MGLVAVATATLLAKGVAWWAGLAAPVALFVLWVAYLLLRPKPGGRAIPVGELYLEIDADAKRVLYRSTLPDELLPIAVLAYFEAELAARADASFVHADEVKPDALDHGADAYVARALAFVDAKLSLGDLPEEPWGVVGGYGQQPAVVVARNRDGFLYTHAYQYVDARILALPKLFVGCILVGTCLERPDGTALAQAVLDCCGDVRAGRRAGAFRRAAAHFAAVREEEGARWMAEHTPQT